MLNDDEQKALLELERQFSVGPVVLLRPRLGCKRSRVADILTLVTSVISTATLLAAGSLGVALQPGTATGPESPALTRLHELLAEARSL